MSSIRIRNIGPINDTGVIPLTHFMLIIGEQSTGKSTFMKILCYCRWFEKKVMVGDYDSLSSFSANDFLVPLQTFHKLNELYFENDLALIEYHGEAIKIVYSKSSGISISKTQQFESVRHNTKLSYLPAERNLLSVISELDAKYRSSTFDVMFNSVIEFNEANAMFNEMKPLKLSVVNGMEYFHEGYNDFVRFDKVHRPLLLAFTSSGVQASVPVSIMSRYLCEITGTPSKRTPQAVQKGFSSDFGKDYEHNRLNYYNYPQLFVEEPEQHLFPQAQANIIEEIVINQQQAREKTDQMGYMFLTTHSPYILMAMNIFLMAGILKSNAQFKDKIEKITRVSISREEFSVYSIEKGKFVNRMDEDTGLIGGNYLDSVSEVMSDRFNTLFRMYVEMNRKQQ